MRKFNIIRDPFDKDIFIFEKDFVEFDTGFTALIGCNGAGKSTLLKMIKKDLKECNIPCLVYNNLDDGGEHAKSKAGFVGDFQTFASLLSSSEGEQININFGNFVKEVGILIRNNEDTSELWILLDAIDSGLSVDTIAQVKNLFFDIIINDNKDKRNIYILAAANSYELCRNSRCFDVMKCKYTEFSDYEDYRTYILESWHTKMNRYENLTRRKRDGKRNI